ncbi:MAG: S1 RNA-binding domain-containing protein [Gemmataceae bacterium]|nr:S1 RNA-binding domain-containing protein [Gemmataceae bacterium]MCI0743439.1 S1 RNA-binding domain-containing protein [Gemmataceae bacterium]
MSEQEKPPEQPAPASTQPASPTPPVAGHAKERDTKRDAPQGYPSGMPRRRVREAVPTLEQEQRYGGGEFKMKDLDDEIAGELEAALAGISDKDLLGADSSQNVQQAAVQDPARKQGKVLAVHGPDVFVDVPGGRSQGVISLQQFPDGPPEVGTLVDFSIEGYDSANGLLLLSRRGAAVIADWSSVADGMTVEARVVETNKGGLSVDVNGIRGFMPISQIDLYRVENAEQFVNQKLLCIVTDVNKEERNLVVSRRAYLEKQREEQRDKLWVELAEGQVREGVIRSVRDIGAFVDLGGVDGLLHVSEMSWKRGVDPETIVQPGQTVRVAVVKLDRDKRRISLSLKELEGNPWEKIEERFGIGQTVPATITRLMDFGAFAELEPGIEGLIHISELGRNKVWRVADVVKPGDSVSVKILSIDPNERRVSLSLRGAIPEVEVKPADDEEADDETEVKPLPKRNIPLRGGVGQEAFLMDENQEPE